MRYEAEGGDPSNAGLQHARVFLEPVKSAHPWITYADLWTLAAVVAIREMGGPDIKWQPGRTDFVDDSKLPPRGRLPDGSKGADHIRFIFYRMGFNDQEIVALSGAHNLGRCHVSHVFASCFYYTGLTKPQADRSGFSGTWVNNPTRFSNTYFRLMTSLNWSKKIVPESGVEQFINYDEDTETELMMLPTDLALMSDPEFAPFVHKYAKDKEAFFEDFANVFAKLLELGIQRDANGRITNSDNVLGGYHSAPKKKDIAGAPSKSNEEADPLMRENKKFQQHHGAIRAML